MFRTCSLSTRTKAETWEACHPALLMKSFSPEAEHGSCSSAVRISRFAPATCARFPARVVSEPANSFFVAGSVGAARNLDSSLNRSAKSWNTLPLCANAALAAADWRSWDKAREGRVRQTAAHAERINPLLCIAKSFPPQRYPDRSCGYCQQESNDKVLHDVAASAIWAVGPQFLARD